MLFLIHRSLLWTEFMIMKNNSTQTSPYIPSTELSANKIPRNRLLRLSRGIHFIQLISGLYAA